MGFLKIREEQMDALAEPRAREFAERLAGFLCEQFPEAAGEPPGEFRAAVREQVEKADVYGLSTEQQAAAYVTCAWLLGPDFDAEFPAAQEMLASADYTPDEKAEWLGEWTEAMLAALEQD
jgi:hypothetical protein